MALALFLALVLLGNSLLNDPDTQWHIAVGRQIWATATWPRADDFSHTFAGQPWIAKEWLSQVVLYLAHEFGGWGGVVALTAFAVALSLAIAVHSLNTKMALSLAIIIGLMMVSSIAPIMNARPHILALPVMTGWVCFHVRASDRGTQPPWLALPLMVLWANLHAGFSIGLVISGAFALEQLFRSKEAERVGTVLRWAAFGLLGMLAAFATPYGLEALWVTLRLFGGAESLHYIQEWQPLPVEAKSAVLISLAAVMIFAMVRDWRTYLARILLSVMLTLMMVRHQRFVVLVAIVLPLIAAAPVAQLLQETGRRFNLFQSFDPLAASCRWRVAAPLLAMICIFTLLILPFQTSPPRTPASALASVPEQLRARPVFNSYDFGGFLVLQNIKTFIDGRTDQLFLDGFMNRANRASDAAEPSDLSAMLDQYKVAWSLVQTGSGEDRLLASMANWKKHHVDPVASVYVRQE